MNQIVVVDVETTGFSPSRDRIVEFAGIRMNTDGSVVDEFVTLINPQRDVGATAVHGLSATLLSRAPVFSEVADAVEQFLSSGAAIAGHNIRFDLRMLDGEIERAGRRRSERPALCTMQLAGGGRLDYCCQAHGVELQRTVHDALGDVRATGKLLAALLRGRRDTVRWIESLEPPSRCRDAWRGVRCLRREEAAAQTRSTPSFISRLLAQASVRSPLRDDDPYALAYLAVLDRACEDRLLSESEAAALLDTANCLGLAGDTARSLHLRFLERLARTYLLDFALSQSERDDLDVCARLLGVADELPGLIARVSQEGATQQSGVGVIPGLSGASICFTGEVDLTCGGRPLTRESLEAIAAEAGLVVKQSVTKSLDILVAADPLSESTKARKARQYGIRVMHAAEFLRRIGIQVG